VPALSKAQGLQVGRA